MGSYIANFAVYTMAMTGLIFFAVYIYKKVMSGGFRSNDSKFLAIEETMSINPRKSLLVVRAGNEKFLVASDMDRTSLIAKLNEQPAESFSTQMRETVARKKEIPQNRIIDLDIKDYSNEKHISLEPIKEKNPAAANLVRGLDRREPYKNKQQFSNRPPVLNIDRSVKQGFGPMSEMAKKINEL